MPAVVAAKVERLSIAFRVEGGGFVHGHAADRIFGLYTGFGHLLFLSLSLLFAAEVAAKNGWYIAADYFRSRKDC